MANTLDEVDAAIKEGANAIECDVFFNGNSEALKMYHGSPCDFGRACKKETSIDSFLDGVAKKDLAMVFFDLKLDNCQDKIKGAKSFSTLLEKYYFNQNAKQLPPILVAIPNMKGENFIKEFVKSNVYKTNKKFIAIGVDSSGHADVISLFKSNQIATGWYTNGITTWVPNLKDREASDAVIKIQEKKSISKVGMWTYDRDHSINHMMHIGIDSILTNDVSGGVKEFDKFSGIYRLATIEDDINRRRNVFHDVFKVEIRTKDDRGAGTDADIYLKIVQGSKSTRQICVTEFIDHDAFERNSTETIELMDVDYDPNEKITEVQIRSNNLYPGSDWHLNWIKIGSKTFKVNKWLTEQNSSIVLKP